ncbi:MAG: hypothetical protein ACOX81_05690 [Candidatus Heteroscillospira sp.]|jgi:hypothetical protein
MKNQQETPVKRKTLCIEQKPVNFFSPTASHWRKTPENCEFYGDIQALIVNFIAKTDKSLTI